MAQGVFDIIVKKLGKKRGDILSLEDVGGLMIPDFSSKNLSHTQTLYKCVYKLKAQEILLPIRAGWYYVQTQKPLSLTECIDTHYWRLAKRMIASEVGADYFLGGIKALEIALKDYSFPDVLLVFTRNTKKTIQISSDYKIRFQTIASGKRNSKNAFYKLKTLTNIESVEGSSFRVANHELSLLDALTIRDGGDVPLPTIQKFLKKYAQTLSGDMLGTLVESRYITAINRLRVIAKQDDCSHLYKKSLTIIKKQGKGRFLTQKIEGIE